MDSIASRLKSVRLEKGWTQEQLAKEAGISQGTVGNIEAGVRRSHGSLPRLADALGVSHNWLRDGGDTRGIDLDQSKSTDGPAVMRSAINTLCICLQEMDGDARKEAGDLLQRLAENPAGRWSGRLIELIERESIPKIGESVGISNRAGKYPLSSPNQGNMMAAKSGSANSNAVDASTLPTGAADESSGSDRNKDQGRSGGSATGTR